MAVMLVVLLALILPLFLVWDKLSHPSRNPDIWLFDIAVLTLALAWAVKDSLLDLWRRESPSLKNEGDSPDQNKEFLREIQDLSKNNFSLTE